MVIQDIAHRNSLFSNIGQRLKQIGSNIGKRLGQFIENPYYKLGKRGVELFSSFLPNPITPVISSGLGLFETGVDYLKDITKQSEPKQKTERPVREMLKQKYDPLKQIRNEEDNFYQEL